jgi:hypothetical protein
MQRFLLFFLIATHFVLAADFDCVFVGSSPIPLFEAIYQRQLGHTVLILEQTAECGGAWKTIDVCGIAHADLGCHQIGSDIQLKEFLETYGGCRIVPMTPPSDSAVTPPENGFYFSGGCYELIHNLMHLIEVTGVTLWYNHRLESATVDLDLGHVVIKTGGKQITAKKIFYTPATLFPVENLPHCPRKSPKKYPHLYLLIQDPTPPRFSYMTYAHCGATRAMNLTQFLNLAHTGRQLIVFQVRKEDTLCQGQQLLDDLKQRNLVDAAAYMLSEEPYVYEHTRGTLRGLPPHLQPYFEMINTDSFSHISGYIEKWKQALKPYTEL